MRVAAIDQGTNTTRLLVADVADGRVDEVHRESRITRLGEGVDARRRLLPLPVARVRNALTDYRRTAERLGAERSLLVATSAVRDAENGDAFLGEVEWSYGFTTRLATGRRRGRAQLPRRDDRPPPGATRHSSSTSAAARPSSSSAARDGIRTARSVDVGSVRMTERFLHGDPPAADELDACAAAVRAALPGPEARRTRAIGVSATIKTFAALDLGLTSPTGNESTDTG